MPPALKLVLRKPVSQPGAETSDSAESSPPSLVLRKSVSGLKLTRVHPNSAPKALKLETPLHRGKSLARGIDATPSPRTHITPKQRALSVSDFEVNAATDEKFDALLDSLASRKASPAVSDIPPPPPVLLASNFNDLSPGGGTHLVSLWSTAERERQLKETPRLAFHAWRRDKAGRTEAREVILDMLACLFILKDPATGHIKQEHPFRSVVALRPQADDERRLVLHLSDASSCDLVFDSTADAQKFVEMLAPELEQAQQLHVEPSHARVKSVTLHEESSHALHQRAHSVSVIAPVPSAPTTAAPVSSVASYNVQLQTRLRRVDRVLVVDAQHFDYRVMRLFDMKRKCRFELPISDVVTLEAPHDDEEGEDGELQLVLSGGLQPLRVFFHAPFERQHFAAQLTALNERIVCHGGDIGDIGARGELLRFPVQKRINVSRQKRLIIVDTRMRVLRTVNQKGVSRDVLLDEIFVVRKSLSEERRLDIVFDNSSSESPWNLLFADAAARELFAGVVARLRSDVRRMADSTDDLPKMKLRPLRVCVASWNTGEISATVNSEKGDMEPRDLSLFLGEPTEHDVIIVGFQECDKPANWFDYVLQYLNGTRISSVAEVETDMQASLGSRFAVVKSAVMWGIAVGVFVRSNLLPHVTHAESASVGTGIGVVRDVQLGNKGGVAVGLRLFDTSICAICVHLAARAERLKRRARDLTKILKSFSTQLSGAQGEDVLSGFDHTWLFGDVNYRTTRSFAQTVRLVACEKLSTILEKEQMRDHMRHYMVLPDFQDALYQDVVPPFVPTYRRMRDSDGFSNKRNQPPSYTDRVLWHSQPCVRGELILDSFESCDEQLGSDHRPVQARFRLTPRLPFFAPQPSEERRWNIQFGQVRFVALVPDTEVLATLPKKPFADGSMPEPAWRDFLEGTQNQVDSPAPEKKKDKKKDKDPSKNSKAHVLLSLSIDGTAVQHGLQSELAALHVCERTELLDVAQSEDCNGNELLRHCASTLPQQRLLSETEDATQLDATEVVSDSASNATTSMADHSRVAEWTWHPFEIPPVTPLMHDPVFLASRQLRVAVMAHGEAVRVESAIQAADGDDAAGPASKASKVLGFASLSCRHGAFAVLVKKSGVLQGMLFGELQVR